MSVIYVIYRGSEGSQVNVQRTFSITHFEFWVTPYYYYFQDFQIICHKWLKW